MLPYDSFTFGDSLEGLDFTVTNVNINPEHINCRCAGKTADEIRLGEAAYKQVIEQLQRSMSDKMFHEYSKEYLHLETLDGERRSKVIRVSQREVPREVDGKDVVARVLSGIENELANDKLVPAMSVRVLHDLGVSKADIELEMQSRGYPIVRFERR